MFWSIQILNNFMLGIRLISNDEFVSTTLAGKYTTRKTGLWILVYAEAYRDEHDAREREGKLKIHGSAMNSLLKRLIKSRLSQK